MNQPKISDLSSKELYFNRELSFLEFNRRVKAQAGDERVPLLERLRFLTIVSSNLDEFFEVRVGLLKQRIALALPHQGADSTPAAVLHRQIRETVNALVTNQYELLNNTVLPALEQHGVRLLRRSRWTAAHKAWIANYFTEQALPVLTPVGLDPAHPFPVVQNKGLNFLITLEGEDAFDRDSGVAILQVPRCLPRVIRMPKEISDGQEFTLISSVIHANINALFPGMQVTGCHQFRLTRDSNMWVDEEEIDDLLDALKGELHGRNYGSSTRLEVAAGTPDYLIDFLLSHHGLGQEDLYVVNGPVNLHRLGALVNQAELDELKHPAFTPGLPQNLGPKQDLLATLRAHDVLLYHPYQSYNPVVDLLWRASTDPKVLAIKMTLYRVGGGSRIVEALLQAARAGKDVTVVVELRARFDEAENISLATRLAEAGANVVYGVVGFKCHAKTMLVVRREGGKLRRYVHVGTGNYHINNARLYTDYSLLSANPELGEDVHRIFMELTGLGKVREMNRLLHSPFTLREQLVKLIDDEATAALAGKPAWIQAKMNSLTEPTVIQALYRASQAGVRIDLVVRGICSLRPGMPGVSDTIQVRSIVGRFLEHDRVYAFHAGGKDLVYIASADWMDRNLWRRVEIACPVRSPELKARILENLALFLKDDALAWRMDQHGAYERVAEKGTVSAQDILLLANQSGGSSLG